MRFDVCNILKIKQLVEDGSVLTVDYIDMGCPSWTEESGVALLFWEGENRERWRRSIHS